MMDIYLYNVEKIYKKKKQQHFYQSINTFNNIE